MSLVLEAHDNPRKTANSSVRSEKVRHHSLTVLGVTCMFLGLVVLPQTHTIATSASSTAGAAEFLVGP